MGGWSSCANSATLWRTVTRFAVVQASIVFKLPLVLGLEPKDLAMPAMTFVVSAINA